VRKGSRKRKAKPRPEYSIRIEALRGTLKQREFAAKLPASPSRISEWESGKRPPVAEGFYRLGSLADNPDDAIWFWKQAGLDDEKLLAAARKIAGERAKEGEPLFEKREVVLIPRFRQTAEGREKAGPPVPLAAEFIPNPDSTICVVADAKSTGFVQSPTGLLIVDEAIKGFEDLSESWGKVFILDYMPDGTLEPKGLYVGRFLPRHTLHDPQLLSTLAILDVIRRDHEFQNLVLGRWPEIGTREYEERRAATGISEEDFVRLRKEQKERGVKEIRLHPGIKVLGQVIGRLSGNVK
jgi:transcriptional regulator with XRE-family HTH domain